MFSTILFTIAAAVCVLAQLMILRSFAAGRIPGASPAPGRAPRRGGELAWQVIPAVVLALVLILTWRSVQSARGADAPPPAGAVES